MTASVACPDRGDLQRLALGQLLEEEAKRLGQHVLDCSACAELLNSLQLGDPLLFELTRVAGPGVLAKLDDPVAEALVRRLLSGPLVDADAVTPSGSVTETAGPPKNDESLPDRLGRYRIIDRLGAGGMGMVCRAHDPELHRDVAVKVPSFSGPADARAAARQRFLREARAAAAVRHPNICPIYDVGEDAGRPYVVMALVEGESLADRLRRQGRFENADEAVALVAQVADALAVVHAASIVHRDLKPGNILLDRAGQPYLADFGLAHLQDSEPLTCPGMLMGTPAYMSPEQANGEGHRVDGRSDIFSLGAVLYQMLSGKRPFDGANVQEVLARLVRDEPTPLREINGAVHRELERICLKALSRRASDRYASAKDMADDLRHFLKSRLPAGNTASTSTTAETRPLKIVPKGLRSFEAYDADFFLELLPGPRDRDGLPDSLRFWKSRIEAADETFRVGLIYGPSGCGKTSLVKAGLLPRLADKVHAIYVEATAEETEARLLTSLRKRFSTLPASLELKETLEAMRRGRVIPAGDKVLIVIDQFEQWLHACQEYGQSELVQALRQCDGGRLQCIVMVRDDFWMAATRFMRELEVRLLEGHNSAAVDLFDTDHATKVLTAFGRAFERLPESAAQTTDEQRQFIQQAAAGLAQDGKVICVHLSLFAEMMKGKAWTPATLKAMGGTEGVGVTFLEETFSAATAPPEHRFHQKAARRVLTALLPESGTDIKGHMRSWTELLAASGQAGRPGDFDDLLRILDGEIRLITPTDPEGKETEESTSQAQSRSKYYQLTHDYLVPSIREWLTRKQKETWRGRAELRLAERTSQWSRAREGRFLPSLPEYLSIVCGVPRGKRTPPQRAMLRAATKRHTLLWGGLAAALILITVFVQQFISRSREENDRRRAELLVEAVLTAPTDAVPYAIENLKPLRRQSLLILRQRFTDESREKGQRLHAAFALAELGEVEESFLVDAVTTASSAEWSAILAVLATRRETVVAQLTARAAQEAKPEAKARLALTLLALGDASVARQLFQMAPDLASRTAFIHQAPTLHLSTAEVRRVLAETTDSSLRYSLCLAIGLSPSERFSVEELAEVLLKLYQAAPDSATHSAADWTLRRWHFELPKLPRGKLADKPPSSEWFVNTQGMTLVEIPAGKFTMGGDDQANKRVEVTLTRPFWLSSREVTVEQFQQFTNDAKYFAEHASERLHGFQGHDDKVSPTPDCPVQQVSWEDTVSFCNWLSRREGLRPVYDAKGAAEVGWSLNAEANGYRLPTEAEWEYACRAGANTEFCFGNGESLLGDYAVYAANWEPHLTYREQAAQCVGIVRHARQCVGVVPGLVCAEAPGRI